MANREQIEAEAYAREYEQLVGKTVKSIVVTKDYDFVGLDFGNKLIAWIQCDPEGNGHGFLAIENMNKKPDPA